jgi:hypothetical protein
MSEQTFNDPGGSPDAVVNRRLHDWHDLMRLIIVASSSIQLLLMLLAVCSLFAEDWGLYWTFNLSDVKG